MHERINHVSVNAVDLAQSTAFYVELFGARPIATPNFGLPVQWLGLGPTQLHLFQESEQLRGLHHFGITVDDLEPVYRAAQRRGAFNWDGSGEQLIEVPGDVVQLYLRDPAGNLLEVDHHGVDRLPEDLRLICRPLWDVHPQSDENMRSRLYVET
jgi:catechol 2,3-dioxygenase-like lactoylglutathione lyase family enzyme